MKDITLTVPMIQWTEPDRTGRVIPREVMEDALKKFKEKVETSHMPIMGETTPNLDVSSITIDLSNISHRVNGITYDENLECTVDITLLDTPKGQMLQKLLDHVNISPRMFGNSEQMVIITMDFVPKDR